MLININEKDSLQLKEIEKYLKSQLEKLYIKSNGGYLDDNVYKIRWMLDSLTKINQKLEN